jgi:hypothetical protein
MTETEGETISFDIETGDEHAELELPRALVELLADEGDTPTDVVADIAQFDCTRRIYEAAHSEDEVDADTRTIEMDALALFEAHFGIAFEELVESEQTGHDDHHH